VKAEVKKAESIEQEKIAEIAPEAKKEAEEAKAEVKKAEAID